MKLVVLGKRVAFTAAIVRALHGAGLEVGAVVVLAPYMAARTGDRIVTNRALAPDPDTGLRSRDIGVGSRGGGGGGGASGGGIRPASAIPVAQSDSFTEAVRKAGATIVTLDRGPGALTSRLADLAPDLCVTACFPLLLAPSALDVAPNGVLNVHPSALPAYRGPVPVFWQLRDGVRSAGVSVHRVTSALDAGPVLGAERVAVDLGATESALTARLAAAGGAVLARIVTRMANGEALPEVPQDESLATVQLWPRPRDFEIDCSWPAERAYRFIEGTRARGEPFTLRTAAGALAVARASGFEPGGTAVPGAVMRSAGKLRIAMSPGTLIVVPPAAAPAR